jgi:hypothetical protein
LSGIAGQTAGCAPHARHPRRLEPAARHRLPRGPGGPEPARPPTARRDLRLRAATSNTTLSAPTCVRTVPTTTGHAFASLHHHPQPPMLQGTWMVQHGGQASAEPTAFQRGRLMLAIARCSRAPGPFKLGRSYGWIGARAWRLRMPISLCWPVAR